jgi:hypothetical protein
VNRTAARSELVIPSPEVASLAVEPKGSTT